MAGLRSDRRSPVGHVADRRGLADSIRGRMQRVGGSATVHSAPGAGTEVELVLPLLVDTVEPQQEVSP